MKKYLLIIVLAAVIAAITGCASQTCNGKPPMFQQTKFLGVPVDTRYNIY
jgi:hypothetical protein